MTHEERIQKIDEFRKFTEDNYGIGAYYDATSNCYEIIDYLINENFPFPKTPVPSQYYVDDWLSKLMTIFSNTNEWDEIDIKLLKVITSKEYWKDPNIPYPHLCFEVFFDDFLIKKTYNDRKVDHITNILKYWDVTGLSTDEFLKGVIENFDSQFSFYFDSTIINFAGRFIIEQAKQDFQKLRQFYNKDKLNYLLQLLLDANFVLDDSIIRKLVFTHDEYEWINFKSIETLLEHDFKYYESLVLRFIDEVISPENYHKAAETIRKIKPENYQNIFFLKEGYFKRVVSQIKSKKYNDGGWEDELKYDYYLKRYITSFEIELALLTNTNIIELKDSILFIFESSLNAYSKYFIFEFTRQVLFEDLKKITISNKQFVQLQNQNNAIEYYKTLFKNLSVEDLHFLIKPFFDSLQITDKRNRETIAVLLSNFKNTILPEANKLLNDKKGEVRQIGALILSLIKTDESQRILLEALDNEKNDDARDVILESLSGVLPVPKTEEELRERIEKAQKRGKLDSPIEKWLDESQLPNLNWLSGKTFTSYEIRYLFYRQSRTKDIRIDSEAKPMLALIDKTTSHDFASALLKTYFTNGADAKQKYCLGLGAILGGDDECNSLKSKVTQWADAGRGKMAEYAVKALALNGSTKALRAVEFFSRKYKNKNKNIGAAANEAFVIVAEDLNISPYELADSIIPDFGFDGLFKEFEVDGEAYRAFIDNDFKLAYLNEDNKVLKSLPKATTNELKEEFKEIGKEIKDIVKSQSSRLEQYLVIQRKWNTEKWQAFFMENPVMFAYAVRLIWGVYDADNQLIDTFRCQEDQTFINAEGDEIELPEDVQIGMVHPISLAAEQITYWTENLYEDDIQPIFPQLTRPVITLNEKDKNLKISREFQGVQYGGYGFISKMEKIGWNRGSVVDSGWISSYFKDFSDLGFTAIITQQGELCVGYYDGNAELNELMFVRKKAVQFGSYIYDEPSNENDERLMAFGEVPAIVFSEVMADMQFFKENDLKKQNEAK